VLAALRARGLAEEDVLKVRAPAGLDLGPSSQEEIAVAILAELVAWRHTRGEATLLAETPAEAVDPVCGMTVAVGPDALQAHHDGETVYFCSAHCKARFEAEPDRYSGLRAP
jgi:xanthine dehydrogenase accessory factor